MGGTGVTPGDIVMVDHPGNPLHGQRVRVVRIDPEMNIAHPACPEQMIVEMIFIDHPTLPEPVGIGTERLAGTPQNARMRVLERDDDGAQGELLL